MKIRLLGLFLCLVFSASCERSAQVPAIPSAAAPAPQVSSEALPSPTGPPVVQPGPSTTPSAMATSTPSLVPGDAADLAQIQRVEDSLAVLVDTGAFLQVYRTDAMLRRYQTSRWTYILDPASHQILQIQPVDETAVQVGSPLSPGQLEQAALDLLARAAPQVHLERLTPAHSSVEGNFIFRWEDRTRPLLEDGLSYPFIQVALTASGDLLNFYNTLPLG